MNAIVLPLPRLRASSWRDKMQACLFLGALTICLTGMLAGALHAGDAQHVALCALPLALLLVVLP